MKKILMNAGLVIMSLVVSLLLLEGIVRLLTKPVYPILRTDASVGTLMERNVRRYIWHDEAQKEVLVLTNGLGYVGTDLPEANATNTIRVALLGDSTTASIEVDYFRAYPYLLEQSLNITRTASEKPVRIWNYGIGGSGTFLEYQRYKRDVAPYHPNTVVLMFSDNDFTDNLNKINFDPEHYAEDTTRHVGLKSFLLRWQLPKFIFGRLQHNIGFLRFLSKLGLYEFNEYTQKAITQGAQAVQQDPAYYNFTFDLIKRLRDHVEADGATFVVIGTMFPKEGTLEDWRKIEQNRRLQDFLQTEHIRFILPGLTPYPSLTNEHLDPKECINWNCNGHLNEKGHLVMSRLLYPIFRDMLYPTSTHSSLWQTATTPTSTKK